MSRSLHATIAAAIAASNVRPVLLYEGVWASGTMRVWTGLGDLSWNSQTWTGIGNLSRVAEITETQETRIEGFTLELTGVPSSEVSRALGQRRHGLAGTLYFGTQDASNVVTAEVFFLGRQDVVEMADGPDDATISVRYLSRLADMRKANGRRFTDADLRGEYADDRGLEFVNAIQDTNIQWGGGWRWP